MHLINFAVVIEALFFSVSCDLHTLQELDPEIKIQTAIGGYFEGCYGDANTTLWTYGDFHSFSSNTNSACIKMCKEKGFAVASTAGWYCHCSNTLPLPPLYLPPNKKAAGNGGPCSITCPGAYVKNNCQGDECCGGLENAYSVYVVDSIDILKELVNRIAKNFKSDPAWMHNKILTNTEKTLVNCRCYSGNITIYLKGNSLTKDGGSSVRTVKSNITVGNINHTVEETTPVNGVENIELVAKSIEKLLVTTDSPDDKPFGNWDLLCDNRFGDGDLSCQKYYHETVGFSETYTTEHGVSLSVKLGVEIESDALFLKSKKTFETSLGYSFTVGFSNTITNTTTEGFRITSTVKKGTKAEVRFFTRQIPVKVKWRANFFADGDVLIDYDGAGITKKVHLSSLLSYDQREVFAIGTIDYGKRKTIIARTRVVDRNGNLVSEKNEEKPLD